jgi:hypothetical protein
VNLYLKKACHHPTLLPLFAVVLLAQHARQAAELIQPNDLQGDIAFLASDDLKGRNSGSAEDRIATDYIASEFMRLGLKPVGDGGTYFQNIDINTADPDLEHTTFTAKIAGVEHAFRVMIPHAFSNNDDYSPWPWQSLHPASACGAIVFAGYGINAPEYGYNDFAGIDVKGKVVLVLGGEPQASDANSKFMGTLDTYHAFNWEKLEELRRRGAAGVLLVRDRVQRQFKPTHAGSPRASGGHFALAGQMWDILTFEISRDVADQLLAPSGKTTDALQAEIDRTLRPDSVEVSESSACMAKAFHNLETYKGRNVVALLEGSDPNLKSQAIVVTAHHDHMGMANGHIYNGADDNASGVAGLLGIATAFQRGKVHPKRSVLFIAYDGEERGLLGSYYYVTHPIIRLDQTVASINMDQIGRNENDGNWPVPPDGNVNRVNVLGTRYNPGLREVIDHENNRVGLKLDYKMDVVDPDSLWSRSDHYWFATLHIPQVEFVTGLHPDYHTDHDTWDRINYPKMTKIVRLVFLSINELASSGKKLAFVPAGVAAQ